MRAEIVICDNCKTDLTGLCDIWTAGGMVADDFIQAEACSLKCLVDCLSAKMAEESA